MSYCVTLPVPVSANQNTRLDMRTGRILTSQASREYRQVVFYAVKQLGQPELPLEGRVGAELHVFFPDYRRRDIDNCLKVTLDGMKGAMYLDDSQVVEIHIYKHVDKLRPRFEVTVYSL